MSVQSMLEWRESVEMRQRTSLDVTQKVLIGFVFSTSFPLRVILRTPAVPISWIRIEELEWPGKEPR